ncbi:MAG: adenine-specific DNA-methyltransferase [Vicingaceae bacterium]
MKTNSNFIYLNGLYWENKVEEIEQSIQNNTLSLKEVKTRKVGKNGPTHRIIEGENLGGLHLLEKKKEKFDLIYIDPPYNTGNKDFKYTDTYFNTEDESRHSTWSSFIYKRLIKAKQLLSDNGVIFLAIDDAEQARLKLICDGIFGEQNFVANFIRKNKAGSGHDSKQVAAEFDYMLCYANNINTLVFNQETVDVESDSKYKFEDQFVNRRGKYYLRDLDYKGSYSKTLDYEITAPNDTKMLSGGAFGKPNTWRWGKEKFNWGIKNDYIVFKETPKGWKVYIKQYQFVDNKDEIRIRKLPHRALINFNNSKGSNELKDILKQDIFSYPKPTDLLKFVINLIPKKDIRILDFFAGSGTTLHAAMLQNKKDGGERSCTLITNNENKICEEVTYSRNKAVIEGYETRRGKKIDGLAQNQLQYFKVTIKK